MLAEMEEIFEGDLADIVRSSVGFSDPFQSFDSTRVDRFEDSFSSMRDPFLVELDGFDHHSSLSTYGSFENSFVLGDHDMLQTTPFQNASGSDLQGVISDNDMINHHPRSPKVTSLINTARAQICSARNPITKKRKTEAKKVVCIAAPTAVCSRQGGGEVVPSDLWAWRKYGQKPIKGSPYPRGYYRCSSSKGCPARKQVERSRTDPNMLVITYTSEHNHPWPTQRNSLAGSTRIPTKLGSHKPANIKEENELEDHDNIHIKDRDSRKGLNDLVPDHQQMLNHIPSDYSDLFADLNDLEADLFNQTGITGELERDNIGGSKSMLDPFTSLFDWSSSNSNATSATNRSNHENS